MQIYRKTLYLLILAVLVQGCSEELSRDEVERLIREQANSFETQYLRQSIAKFAVRTEEGVSIYFNTPLKQYLLDEGYLTMELDKEKGDVYAGDRSKLGDPNAAIYQYNQDFYTLGITDKMSEFRQGEESSERGAYLVAPLLTNGKLGLAQLVRLSNIYAPYYLPAYTPEFNEITGIRNVEEGSLVNGHCDALAEYTIRNIMTPFGELGWKRNLSPIETKNACFARYDDGWRLVN